MNNSARTHVVIPCELLEAVDRLVGSRRRSEFIAEALREKVAREAQRKALREAAGILNPADYPEWSSSEKVVAWVRDLRSIDERRTQRKLSGSDDALPARH